MKRFICFFLLVIMTMDLWAQGKISEIVSPEEALIEIYESLDFKTGKLVAIVSRQENRIVAFGKLSKVDLSQHPGVAQLKIIEVIGNSMVMSNDIVFPVNYELMKKYKVPGFYSLTLGKDNSIPAQYKQLVYLGVFTSEGHTLDRNEVLLSPFQVQYGVTDNIGVKVVNALWLDGYANLGLKYQALRNEYAKFSLNTLGAFKVQSRDWIWQMGGVLTLPSNAKYQTHLAANFTLDPQFQDAHATKGLTIFKDSDIRNIYEYITDSWNRVLFGPVYNVQLQTFGGTFSYMWIWDSFHMSLGMATRDFTQLHFDQQGYYYVYDFFWRF